MTRRECVSLSWVSALGSSEDGKGVSSPRAGGSRFRPEESRTAFPPTDRCPRGVEPRQASGPLSSSSPKPGLELVVLGPLVEGIFVTVFNHTPIPFPARLGGAYHSESARLPSTRPVPSPVPRQVRPRGGNLAGLTRRARVSLSWIRVLVPVVRQGKSVHGGGPSAPGPVQSQG